LRCAICGDVIGTYEPATLVEDDAARTTSAAAEPDLDRHAGELFHAACFARAHDDAA
jgi:hypothetical protein